MKVAAAMMVRDEEEAVASTIAYHRAAGVDEVLVVDNGSTDATPRVLRHLAAMDPAVRWLRDEGPFDQGRLVTGLVEEARRRGAQWVLPVDVDELWWTPRLSIRHVLAGAGSAGALRCRLVTFVQDRDRPGAHPASRLSMRWSVAPLDGIDRARADLDAGSASLLQVPYPPKHVVRTSTGMRVGAGCHEVWGAPGPAVDCPELTLLHAPVRDRPSLVRRAATGQRLAAANGGHPDVSWHNRHYPPDAPDAVLETEWRACSASAGHLDLPSGARVAVVDDPRLRQALAPHVRLVDRLLGAARGRG